MLKLFDSNIPEDQMIFESLDSKSFIKTANLRDLPAEVDEAIKGLDKKPGHHYVLLTAMGDGEVWGPNKNADFFGSEAMTGVQEADENVNKERGPVSRYKTFEDAHFFHHHKNKFSIDKDYGYVPSAIRFPKMRTTILIVGIDEKRDPQTIDEIKRGLVPAFSMGCKLPWDECSICKKRATKRSEYCFHLSQMGNHILPDGRRVFSYNRKPRFFDISKVLKPAFNGGQMLMKVAGLIAGTLSVDLANEFCLVDPDGELEKESSYSYLSRYEQEFPLHVREMMDKIASVEPELHESVLDRLCNYDLKDIWGGFYKAGIVPTLREFTYILLKKSGREDLALRFANADPVIQKCMDPDDLSPSLLKLIEFGNGLGAEHCFEARERKMRSIETLDDRILGVAKGELKPAAKGGPRIEVGPSTATLWNELRKKFREKVENPITKTAGLVRASLLGAGAFAAPYIVKAQNEQKQMYGEQTGIVSDLVSRNAGKLAVLGTAVAAAPKPMYNSAKAIAGILRGR